MQTDMPSWQKGKAGDISSPEITDFFALQEKHQGKYDNACRRPTD